MATDTLGLATKILQDYKDNKGSVSRAAQLLYGIDNPIIRGTMAEYGNALGRGTVGLPGSIAAAGAATASAPASWPVRALQSGLDWVSPHDGPGPLEEIGQAGFDGLPQAMALDAATGRPGSFRQDIESRYAAPISRFLVNNIPGLQGPGGLGTALGLGGVSDAIDTGAAAIEDNSRLGQLARMLGTTPAAARDTIANSIFDPAAEYYENQAQQMFPQGTDVGANPWTVKGVGSNILESAPQLAVQAGAAAATGGGSLIGQAAAFGASALPMEIGGAQQAGVRGLMEKNPGMTRAQANKEAAPLSIVQGGANAALEQISGAGIFAPAGKIASKVGRMALKGGTALATGGVTEAMQEGVNIAGEKALGINDEDDRQVLSRIGMAGLAGGILEGGAGLAHAAATRNAANAPKNTDLGNGVDDLPAKGQEFVQEPSDPKPITHSTRFMRTQSPQDKAASAMREGVLPETPTDAEAEFLTARAKSRGVELVWSAPGEDAGGVTGMQERDESGKSLRRVIVNRETLAQPGRFGKSLAMETAIDELAHDLDDFHPQAGERLREILGPEIQAAAAQDYIERHKQAWATDDAGARQQLGQEGIYKESLGTALQMGMGHAEARARLMAEKGLYPALKRLWNSMVEKAMPAGRRRVKMIKAFEEFWNTELPAAPVQAPAESGSTISTESGKVAAAAAEPIAKVDATGQGRLFSIGAWHGTPHDFDKFNSDKIGTGEGAASYGHGHYFAGERKVAEYYRQKLAPGGIEVTAPKYALVTANHPDEAVRGAGEFVSGQAQGDLDAAIKYVKDVYYGSGNKTGMDILRVLEKWKDDGATIKAAKAKGSLLQVELAPNEDEMLDWDKPGTQQSAEVQAILKAQRVPLEYTGEQIYRRLSNDLTAAKAEPGVTSSRSRIPNRYSRDDKGASAKLRELGIRGIRYLDQASRDKGAGTSNYVIFDDNDVEIKERFSIAPKDDGKEKGPFGPVYKRFTDRFKNALSFLRREKNGEAAAALTHPDVPGPISLVYGKAGNPQFNYEDGFGIAKIDHKHPGDIENLPAVWGQLKKVQSESRPDKIVLAGNGHFAVVRKGWNGVGRQWLVTFYAKTEEGSANERRSVSPETPASGRDGTPPSAKPSSDVSIGDRGTNVKSDSGAENRFSVSPNSKHVKKRQGDIDAEIASGEPRTLGRPDLANPASGKARTVVDAVDQARKDLDIPPVKTDRETFAQAEDRLSKDYEGEKTRLLEVARAGGQLSDVDTVVAKKIVADSTLKAISMGDQQAYEDAINLANAYRDTGTDAARAFRQRHDDHMSPDERNRAYLAEIVTAPSKGTKREIVQLRLKFKEATTPKAKEKILKKMENANKKQAKEIAAIAKRIRKDGIDVATLSPAQLADPGVISQVARSAQVVKATVPAKLREWWINSILSGPPTHAANITGNAANGAWELLGQRLIEASLNLVSRNKGHDAAQFKDFAAMGRGLGPAFKLAGRAMLHSWTNERPWFRDRTTGSDGKQKVYEGLEQYPGAAIAGKKGRIIRTSGRALMAEDQFFQAFYGTLQAYAIANRKATQEGLKGAKAIERANELLANPRDEVWLSGLTEAERLTFQEELDPASKAIQILRAAIPGSYFVVPFVKTPVNIFKAAARKTPVVGQVVPAYRIIKAILPGSTEHYSKNQLSRDLANALIGWGLMFAMWSLVGGEGEEPWITGSRERDLGKAGLQARTAPAMSIKIGDSWVSYSRIEPFATTLGALVDATYAAKTAKDTGAFQAAIGSLGTSLKDQLQDKTFLKGISDIIDVVENSDGGWSAAGRWATNFASSWVPSIARLAQTAAMPTVPELKTRLSDDRDLAATVGKRTLQRALPAVFEPTPKIDPWGREVDARNFTEHPKTDYAWRMLSPLRRVPMDDVLDVDRLLVNWNNKVENDVTGELSPWEPEPPPATLRIDGRAKPYKMTDEEYASYLKESGSASAKRVQAFIDSKVFSVEDPTEANIERIRKIRAEESKKVRDRMEAEIKKRKTAKPG